MTTSQFITTYEQPETLADELFGNELKGYGSELNGRFDETPFGTAQIYMQHDSYTNIAAPPIFADISNTYMDMFAEINERIDAFESENYTQHTSMQTMIDFLARRIAELEKVVYNEK